MTRHTKPISVDVNFLAERYCSYAGGIPNAVFEPAVAEQVPADAEERHIDRHTDNDLGHAGQDETTDDRGDQQENVFVAFRHGNPRPRSQVRGTRTVTWTINEGTVTASKTSTIAITNPNTVSSISAVTDNHALNIGAGHIITVTVTTSGPVTVAGSSTLQLNDNEVAAYTIGSGTNTLTFTYVVQPVDAGAWNKLADGLRLAGLAE